MVAFSEYDNQSCDPDFGASVEYNPRGQVGNVTYSLALSASQSIAESYSYIYDGEGRVIQTAISGIANATVGYFYDSYERLSDKQLSLGNFHILSSYNYRKTSGGYEYLMYTSNEISMYISSIVNSDNVITSETSYSYTYDDKGNITKIVYSSGEEIRYVYDDLGQLIREDNGPRGFTYIYTYDNAGNILSAKTYELTAEGVTPDSVYATEEYAYSSSAWGDLLTYSCGYDLIYDSIGNPLFYANNTYDYVFTWQGRELKTAAVGNKTYSFTYNDSGVRTSKTVNGVTTTYYWNGTQLIAEETSGNITVYVYDAEASPIGMQYHSSSYAEGVWDIYWYEKNLQGDIVAVYNNTGTRLVTYKYDAWGQHTTHYEALGGNTSVTKNPFRYRGYYYDIDLGLYYNISRYYDAYTGRWINADVYVATGQGLTGCNTYAYCGNNPVMRVDGDGEMWQFVPALDPRNSTRGGGDDDYFVGGSYDSSAYNSYRIRVNTAYVDSTIGGYYYGGGKSIGGSSGQYAFGTVTVTDEMANTCRSNATIKNGWKVGDSIDNKTSKGNDPSWSTVRQRHWKNEAFKNPHRYSASNLLRMKKGLAPIGLDGYSYELHHPYGRSGAYFYIFTPITKTEHILLHKR